MARTRLLGDKADILMKAAIVAVHQDEKRRATEFELDLGTPHMPVAQMRFGFDDPFFHRAFELSGRNSTTETVKTRTERGTVDAERETPWSGVASGVLFRVIGKNSNSDNVKVDSLRAPYRYFLLRVLNADDRPLKLTTATAVVRTAAVVFQADKGLFLIGGNRFASPPNYDLSKSVRDLDVTALPAAHLGPFEDIAAKAPLAPWSERHSVLIFTALAVAAVLMIGLVVNSMRKVAPPPDQP